MNSEFHRRFRARTTSAAMAFETILSADSSRKEAGHVRGPDGVSAAARVSPPADFRFVRGTISRTSADPRLLVSRSVSGNGVRAADWTREPSRSGDLSAGRERQALPCRVSRGDLAQHSGRRQPNARLANLSRPGAGPHRAG